MDVYIFASYILIYCIQIPLLYMSCPPLMTDGKSVSKSSTFTECNESNETSAFPSKKPRLDDSKLAKEVGKTRDLAQLKEYVLQFIKKCCTIDNVYIGVACLDH